MSSSGSGGFWPGDEPEKESEQEDPESESTGWQLPESDADLEPGSETVIAHRPGEIDIPPASP